MTQVHRLDGSTVDVGTIWCIGRNVFAHAVELGNSAPTEPIVFLKSRAALRPLDAEGEVAFPDETFHHEAELVLLVGEPVPLGTEAGWDAVEAVALGLDLTRRPVQSALKKSGLPWAVAKSFYGAAPMGPFVPRGRFEDPDAIRFSLAVNGETRQQGDLTALTFDVPFLLTFLARFAPLSPGDLIFTGTPAGVADFRVGDRFRLAFEGTELAWEGVL